MKRVLLLLVVLALLVGGVALSADFYLFLKRPVIVGGQTVTYQVAPGATFKRVSADLGRRGVLNRGLYWRLLARAQGEAKNIKAGEYRLKGPLTPQALLARLVAGKTIQYKLTLVDGWTFKQVLAALARDPDIRHTLHKRDDVMALLGKPGMAPEGWFFPDTYYFPQGTTDLDLLRRSYKTMKKHLAALWPHRDAGLWMNTPYQALILASIVEKETAVAAERPEIAAVFLSRLDKGMRLQTDPTVIYGLGASYDGNIRRRDLRRDTPYNTYLHKGLPPTPIAMPSAAALRAVLHPAATRDLFFVAKNDGTHHFSKTYKQHRKAVIKYQLDGKTPRRKAQSQTSEHK